MGILSPTITRYPGTARGGGPIAPPNGGGGDHRNGGGSPNFGDRLRRARLDLAREYLRRMFHNSMVVFQWANPEYACMRKEPEAFDALTKARITELRQASMLFYNVAFFVLAEMNFWLLISSLRWLPLPVPSAAELRRYASLDLLGAYQRVKTAAAELASFFGEDEASQILELM